MGLCQAKSSFISYLSNWFLEPKCRSWRLTILDFIGVVLAYFLVFSDRFSVMLLTSSHFVIHKLGNHPCHQMSSDITDVIHAFDDVFDEKCWIRLKMGLDVFSRTRAPVQEPIILEGRHRSIWFCNAVLIQLWMPTRLLVKQSHWQKADIQVRICFPKAPVELGTWAGGQITVTHRWSVWVHGGERPERGHLTELGHTWVRT